MKKKYLLIGSSLLFIITICNAQQGKRITLFDGGSTNSFRGYNMQAFPDQALKVGDSALVTQTGVPNVDLITKEAF